MKEKTFNYTLKYYLFQMSNVKALTIFSWIFAVIGFPLFCIAQNLMNYSRDFDEISAPMLIVSVMGMFGICALSFITPIAVFKHLYTKTSADNILSLPLTATQRFIGDIGTILTSYILPLLTSAVLSWIGESITVTVLDRQITNDYYEGVFLTFLIIFEFVALNTAVTTICGRMAEAILYPIAINILMPLALMCGGLIAYTDCYGVYDGMNDLLYSGITLLFPASTLFGMGYVGKATYIIVFIISVIYLALAYFGYTKRLAQNIGKPFVFKYSYLITSVIVGLSFIICYTQLSELAPFRGENIPVTLLTIALILLIIMVVMEMLNYRKIHSLPKFAVHYGATFGGGMLICYLLLISRGFGAGYYVPDVKSVEEAGLSGFYREADWENGVSNNINAVEEEAFKLLLEEQQLIIDNYDPNSDLDEKYAIDADYTVFNTSLNYKLKNGSNIYRNYSINTTTPDLWKKLYQTESYRLDRLTYLNYFADNLAEEAEIRLVNRHSMKIYFTFIQEKLFESELYKALEADLKADTEYGRHDENSVAMLQIGDVTDYWVNGKAVKEFDTFRPISAIPIYESYTNTLSVLSQYGTVPTAEEATLDSVKNSDVFMLYRVKAGGIDISAEEVWGSESGSSAVFITADEFKELTSKQVKYNNFDGSDEYVYYLTRGMCYYMNSTYISHNDKIEAIEKDGMPFNNYDFLENHENYGQYYPDMMINTEYNDLCSSLFEGRTVFTLTETETGAITVAE